MKEKKIFWIRFVVSHYNGLSSVLDVETKLRYSYWVLYDVLRFLHFKRNGWSRKLWILLSSKIQSYNVFDYQWKS